jgi:hypothetical protein
MSTLSQFFPSDDPIGTSRISGMLKILHTFQNYTTSFAYNSSEGDSTKTSQTSTKVLHKSIVFTSFPLTPLTLQCNLHLTLTFFEI